MSIAEGESDERSEDSSPSSSSEVGVSAIPPPPPPPPVVNDEDMDASSEEEEEEDDEGRGPPKLFAMNLVNSYGNAKLEQLENDGKPISISGEFSGLLCFDLVTTV